MLAGMLFELLGGLIMLIERPVLSALSTRLLFYSFI